MSSALLDDRHGPVGVHEKLVFFHFKTSFLNNKTIPKTATQRLLYTHDVQSLLPEVTKMVKKRGRGRPRGFGSVPRSYKDRFQKFYYEHRARLNQERRKLYEERKAKGLCVRCGKIAVKGSVFCRSHLDMSRKYNKN